MEKKGTILIVDDRMQEKIGSFLEYLNIDGYSVEMAETLEKAEKALENLLNSNTLDGIILDFSFPINEENPNVNIDGTPNGIFLLKKYEFKIGLKGIPIVINTTADEEYKKKHLGDLKNFSIPMYNVDHETNPLARASGKMAQEILYMFNQRYEQRKTASQIEQDNKWHLKGRAGTYDAKNGKYHYNRDGD